MSRRGRIPAVFCGLACIVGLVGTAAAFLPGVIAFLILVLGSAALVWRLR